jgi:hypothetical protein
VCVCGCVWIGEKKSAAKKAAVWITPVPKGRVVMTTHGRRYQHGPAPYQRYAPTPTKTSRIPRRADGSTDWAGCCNRHALGECENENCTFRHALPEWFRCESCNGAHRNSDCEHACYWYNEELKGNTDRKCRYRTSWLDDKLNEDDGQLHRCPFAHEEDEEVAETRMANRDAD